MAQKIAISSVLRHPFAIFPKFLKIICCNMDRGGVIVFFDGRGYGCPILLRSSAVVQLSCTSLISVQAPLMTLRSSAILSHGDAFLSKLTLKCCPVLCQFLGGLNGEINLLTGLRPPFQTLRFHVVLVLSEG